MILSLSTNVYRRICGWTVARLPEIALIGDRSDKGHAIYDFIKKKINFLSKPALLNRFDQENTERSILSMRHHDTYLDQRCESESGVGAINQLSIAIKMVNFELIPGQIIHCSHSHNYRNTCCLIERLRDSIAQ